MAPYPCSMAQWLNASFTCLQGWRSFNAFWGVIDQIKMETIMAAMVNKSRTVGGKGTSLLDLGYNRVGVDGGWCVSPRARNVCPHTVRSAHTVGAVRCWLTLPCPPCLTLARHSATFLGAKELLLPRKQDIPLEGRYAHHHTPRPHAHNKKIPFWHGLRDKPRACALLSSSPTTMPRVRATVSLPSLPRDPRLERRLPGPARHGEQGKEAWPRAGLVHVRTCMHTTRRQPR